VGPGRLTVPRILDAPYFSEEECRAIRAEAEPIRRAVTDRLVAMGLVDEDAWVDELERRTEGKSQFSGAYVQIAAGVRASGG
jgi:hypothetical protein